MLVTLSYRVLYSAVTEFGSCIIEKWSTPNIGVPHLF